MFNVTYQISTPESAAFGEYAETGFIAESVSFREAMRLVFETRTSHCDGIAGIDADESPIDSPRYVTVYNGMEFRTGAYEARSIHFPEHLTPATRRRIYRLIAG